MNEVLGVTPDHPEDRMAQVLARLERWRGAQQTDAQGTQWHYWFALAQRMVEAPLAVQRVLIAKLERGLDAMEQPARVSVNAVDTDADRACEPAVGDQAREPAAVTPTTGVTSRLAQLNQHIEEASASPADASEVPSAVPSSALRELKSVARFRETWALISAEAEVDLAAFRAPSNAGPLNAHRLVLQALGQMRDLSPDYLRHCLSQVDTLMWLDQAYSALKHPAAKSAASKSTSRKPTTSQRKR